MGDENNIKASEEKLTFKGMSDIVNNHDTHLNHADHHTKHTNKNLIIDPNNFTQKHSTTENYTPELLVPSIKFHAKDLLEKTLSEEPVSPKAKGNFVEASLSKTFPAFHGLGVSLGVEIDPVKKNETFTASVKIPLNKPHHHKTGHDLP